MSSYSDSRYEDINYKDIKSLMKDVWGLYRKWNLLIDCFPENGNVIGK